MVALLQLLLDLQCMVRGHGWTSLPENGVYCSECGRSR